ncbi:MAG: DUF4249 family protein [Flavobacteriaceae bacterium]|nr:DUF4249 family protein [Flavobacteriaceae bacterium]
MKNNCFTYLYLLLITTSCVDQIDSKSDHHTQLVISGLMIVEEGHIEVEIVETTALNNNDRAPVNDIELSLHTRYPDGSTTLITDQFEVENGNYTSISTVAPLTNNRYWIEAISSDNTQYISSEEPIFPTVEIKDLRIVNGALRVIFSDPPNTRNQYAVYISYYLKNVHIENEIVFLEEQLTTSTDVLFNGNSEAFIEFSRQTGNYAEVQLINLNTASYRFLNNIQSQLEENEGFEDESGDPGQLFRNPPIQLYGNIYNKQTKRPILGNFNIISSSYASINF